MLKIFIPTGLKDWPRKKILFNSLIKKYNDNKSIRFGFEWKSQSITYKNEIKILNQIQKENIPFGIHGPFNLLADFINRQQLSYDKILKLSFLAQNKLIKKYVDMFYKFNYKLKPLYYNVHLMYLFPTFHQKNELIKYLKSKKHYFSYFDNKIIISLADLSVRLVKYIRRLKIPLVLENVPACGYTEYFLKDYLSTCFIHYLPSSFEHLKYLKKTKQTIVFDFEHYLQAKTFYNQQAEFKNTRSLPQPKNKKNDHWGWILEKNCYPLTPRQPTLPQAIQQLCPRIFHIGAGNSHFKKIGGKKIYGDHYKIELNNYQFRRHLSEALKYAKILVVEVEERYLKKSITNLLKIIKI